MNFISKLSNLYFDKKRSEKEYKIIKNRNDEEYEIIKNVINEINPDFFTTISYCGPDEQRKHAYRYLKRFASMYHELEAENACLKLEMNGYRYMCYEKMNKQEKYTWNLK